MTASRANPEPRECDHELGFTPLSGPRWRQLPPPALSNPRAPR
jgi:hypothetical protein